MGTTEVGQAAASLYRDGDRLWLVTAGHVITNRDADTFEPLGLAVPDTLLIFVLERDDATMQLTWRKATLGLYDESGEAAWIRHPDGMQVDLAAVEVTGSSLDGGAHLVVNDELDEYVDFDVEAADDVFILGYPEGLSGGGHLPVWKSGTVASELIPSRPYVLADAATRRGMSGGPVFARRVGVVNPPGVKGATNDTVIGQAYRFLGVYASRIVHDDSGMLAQIGRVFLWREVERMIGNELYWKVGPEGFA